MNSRLIREYSNQIKKNTSRKEIKSVILSPQLMNMQFISSIESRRLYSFKFFLYEILQAARILLGLGFFYYLVIFCSFSSCVLETNNFSSIITAKSRVELRAGTSKNCYSSVGNSVSF